jgi:hypothetical protein
MAEPEAWPTVYEAASILQVDVADIAREVNILGTKSHDKELRIHPSEVMLLNRVFKNESFNRVAALLIEIAARAGEEKEVEEQMDEFFESLPSSQDTGESFLEFMEELPEELASKIKAVHAAGQGRRPTPITGNISNNT